MAYYDFIELEIKGLTRFLAKTLFQKDLVSTSLIDENGVLSEEEFFRYTLFKLVSEGNINEAENMLFQQLEAQPQSNYLPVAVAFYDRINKLDDDTLEASQFSREEIAEGLAAIKKICGDGAG